MTPALVVGAGLSGLATAWCLRDRGFMVSVVEAANQPGGLIHTELTANGPVETAANAFVWSDVVRDWFARLDIDPVFARPESRRRYIFRGGRARRWPLTVGESATLVLKLGAAGVSRRFGARERESAADWGDRIIGRAGRQWLLDPAMQGIYAAPADQLSASLIFGGGRRPRPRMAAPAGGMGQFVERLHRRLVDRGVHFAFAEPATRLDADRPVAVCTGAPAAARLLAPWAPRLAEAVAQVRVSGLASVTAFFEPRPDDLRGFGVLFPRGAQVDALGVLINTDIFEGRGRARSETWIYGNREGAVTAWSDARLRDALVADRRTLNGRHVEPLTIHIARRPEAIPVYDDTVSRVANALDTLPPWIAVAGNYLGQIGVSRLLEVAEKAARRLEAGK
jgi:oxygen-dependent protoporphyrinogen oxidase